MKNNECTIYISTKNGRTQIFRKGKNGWAQTSSRGKIYPMTAEQVLSHILPPLAGKSKGILEVKANKSGRKNEKQKTNKGKEN